MYVLFALKLLKIILIFICYNHKCTFYAKFCTVINCHVMMLATIC